MYTSFFAVLSLVFYALENDRISQDTMKDAIVGRQTLAALAKRSMAADRCTATLTVNLLISPICKHLLMIFRYYSIKSNPSLRTKMHPSVRSVSPESVIVLQLIQPSQG